ncbi:MAG: M23 family metallopeptidase [Desulfovibrio sp.]
MPTSPDFYILDEKTGTCRICKCAKWIVPVVLLVFFSLGTSAFLMGQEYLRGEKIQAELDKSRQTVRQQNVQLLGFARNIESLEKHFTGIAEFDSKLGIIANNQDIKSTSSDDQIGGKSRFDFSRAFYNKEFLIRNMHRAAEELSTGMHSEMSVQQSLMRQISQKIDMFEATPSIWPVKGVITSGYGWRVHPVLGQRSFHPALDIAQRKGTPIIAPAKGVISYTGRKSGYGIVVFVDHGNGIRTRYAHLNRSKVKIGQRIDRGQIIGLVGNTGRTTGAHLHYEVLVNGKNVNPHNYILRGLDFVPAQG